MGEDEHRLVFEAPSKLLARGSAGWVEWVPNLLDIGVRLLRGLGDRGVYEVLEYESTLELKDSLGKRASFKKRERVRYLQNNIIAFQDQAWGDGEILIGYKCSPGVPVDMYRSGHKTQILISRREMRSRGDEDEFNIEWGIRNGFKGSSGYWETEVEHHCERIKMQVIFPQARRPLGGTFTEAKRKHSAAIEPRHLKQLPDGSWLVDWEVLNPRLGERFIIRWTW